MVPFVYMSCPPASATRPLFSYRSSQLCLSSCPLAHVLTHECSSSRRCSTYCAWYAGCFSSHSHPGRGSAPAQSGRGSLATASLVLRVFTCHAWDSVDRALDGCGKRLELGPCNLRESGKLGRSFSARLPQALAMAFGCASRQSLEK